MKLLHFWFLHLIGRKITFLHFIGCKIVSYPLHIVGFTYLIDQNTKNTHEITSFLVFSFYWASICFISHFSTSTLTRLTVGFTVFHRWKYQEHTWNRFISGFFVLLGVKSLFFILLGIDENTNDTHTNVTKLRAKINRKNGKIHEITSFLVSASYWA